MVLVRDSEGQFYEVPDSALNGHKVDPPLPDDDAYFPASDYRWDPRDNPPDSAGEIAGYHWQPPAYRWRPTDYRWHPPRSTGGGTSQ